MATKFVEAVLRPHVLHYAMNGDRCHKDIAVRSDLKLTTDFQVQPLSFDVTTDKGRADLALALKMLEIAFQRGKQGRSDELAGLTVGSR